MSFRVLLTLRRGTRPLLRVAVLGDSDSESDDAESAAGPSPLSPPGAGVGAASDPAKRARQRAKVVDEMVTTEREFLLDLNTCLEGWPDRRSCLGH